MGNINDKESRDSLPKVDPIKTYQPEVVVLHSPGEVDRYAASLIIALLQQKPDARLTMPTGRRVSTMYAHLVAAYQAGEADFSRASIYNLDEYWPLPKAHPSSYASFMEN